MDQNEINATCAPQGFPTILCTGLCMSGAHHFLSILDCHHPPTSFCNAIVTRGGGFCGAVALVAFVGAWAWGDLRVVGMGSLGW